MKRLCFLKVLLLAFLAGFLSCRPEPLEPLYGRAGNIVEEGKMWNVWIVDYATGPEGFRYSALVVFREDTLLNGEIWKKGFKTLSIFEMEEEFHGYYRQEGQKIYEYNPRMDSVPFCIFDFEKKEGDKIPLRENIRALVVQVFDTVLPHDQTNKKRRCMLLYNDVGVVDYWVEDIGSLSYGLTNCSDFDATFAPLRHCLQCCEKDGVVFYQAPLK